MPLNIATWNVNSIRIRTHLLEQFHALHAPDVICLQETKTPNEFFPEKAIRSLGYEHIAAHGEKSYNGVAILSKIPLSDIETYDLLENGSCRHVRATLPDGTALHNFYVPAGGDIPDPELNPKFEEKLRFMDRMREWSDGLIKQEKTVIVGDFNIAPYEQDVWSHKQLLKIVSHTPVETDRMARLRDSLAWVDTARHFTPMEEKLYSWWSYRNRDWKKSNRGRRLDHIWVSPGLTSALLACHTHYDARDWSSPSDHVPVMTTLDI